MATYTYGPFPCTGVDSSTGLHEFYGRVIVDETANTSANTSSISWRFEIYINRSAYISNYTATSNNKVDILIQTRDGSGNVITTYQNDTVANVGTVAMNGHYSSNPVVLRSGTATINHENDGSCNLYFKAVYTKNLAYMQSITVEGTKALTKIPRASSVTSVTNVEVGSAPTVKWTPAVSTYTYTVGFSCGGWSYTSTLISPGSTSEQTYNSYTIPDAVANQITNSSSATATCTITTYSDSGGATSLGSATKTFTITVPNNSTYKPTATITVTPSNQFGSYNLTDRTTYAYSCTSSAGKSGATITSYAVNVSNSAGTIIYSSGSSTGNIGAVSTATTLTFALTVTDSRGYSSSSSQSVTVTAYSKPTISSYSAVRGTGTGSSFRVDEGGGTVARVTYSTSHTGISGNSLTVQIKYTHQNSAKTASATAGTNQSVYINPTTSGVTGFLIDTSYVLTISAYDTVSGSSNPVTATVTLSGATYPIDFMPDASGMAINKVATRSGSFQVGSWDIEIHGNKGIKFYDSADTLTGEIKTGSMGIVFTVFSFTGGGINLAQLFGRNIQGVVSVTARGYSNPIYWYVADATPSSYAVAVYNMDGSTFSNTIAFDVVAIPA